MATALIKFKQGATQGDDGEALIHDLDDPVEVENSDNAGVASWEIQILEVPYGSAVDLGVLAQGNGAVPLASFEPDVLGGCYRIQLKVWPLINQQGDPDTDIRCVGSLGTNGLMVPPPQEWPEPLPHPSSGRPGAKPDELNFGGQVFGWAGTGNDGLLRHALRVLGPGGVGPEGPQGPQGDPGDDGETGDTGPAGTLTTIGRHSASGAALLLQFDGSLADTGPNTLSITVDAGVAVYCELWPGFRGIDLGGQCRLKCTSSQLEDTGDFTFAGVFLLYGTQTTAPFCVHTQGSGETEADNTLYQWGVLANRAPNVFQESGAGTNASASATDVALPFCSAFHLVVTRSATGVWKYYVDNELIWTSAALGAASGGTAGDFYFGGGVGTLCGPIMCGSLYFSHTEADATAVAALYNASMGQLY